MTQHRPLAGGEAVVEADGATVGQIIDDLDRRFPGLGDALRAGSSAGIDGEIHAEPEFVRVQPDTVVYFVAPLAGGGGRHGAIVGRTRDRQCRNPRRIDLNPHRRSGSYYSYGR